MIASSEPVDTTADRVPLSWYVGLALREFSRANTWLAGPELGLRLGRARVALLALGHRSSDRLGHVTFESTTAAFAYEPWTLGNAPALALRARGELGATYAAGDPASGISGHTQLALQAAALLEVGFRFALGTGVQAELACTGGLARGLVGHADVYELVATHGPLFGAMLTIGSADPTRTKRGR